MPKNTGFVEANVISMYVDFQLHPLTFRRRLLNIYSFLVPQQAIKHSDLDKSHAKVIGLLNNYFCKNRFQKSPIRLQTFVISYFNIIN